MRHETLTLYKFYELNEEAQDRAIKEVGPAITEYANDDDCHEYRAALTEIEKAFGIKVDDYTVGSYYPYDFRFHFTESRWANIDWDDITEARKPSLLLRYFNWVDDCCREGKYYFGRAHYNEVDHTVTMIERHSKVLFPEYDCMLTGTWCTNAVDDIMNDFWPLYRTGYSIREFVNFMLNRFFLFWQEDLEYHESRAYIVDEIDSQEMEFLADGRRYC